MAVATIADADSESKGHGDVHYGYKSKSQTDSGHLEQRIRTPANSNWTMPVGSEVQRSESRLPPKSGGGKDQSFFVTHFLNVRPCTPAPIPLDLRFQSTPLPSGPRWDFWCLEFINSLSFFGRGLWWPCEFNFSVLSADPL
jgi:hypothetical protein